MPGRRYKRKRERILERKTQLLQAKDIKRVCRATKGDHRIAMQAEDILAIDESIAFMLPLPLSGIECEVDQKCDSYRTQKRFITVEQIESRCEVRKIIAMAPRSGKKDSQPGRLGV